MNITPTALLFIFGIAFIMIGGINPLQVMSGEETSLSGDKTLEARLKKLEAREEIRQLLMDYGRFVDQRDFASFSELFAKNDGEWIGGFGRARGSKAIRELMESNLGTGAPKTYSCHLFSNEMINVNGDKATAITKWIFVVPGESNRPQMFFLGHYEDTMIREDGRWKFLCRTVHADIPADDQIK